MPTFELNKLVRDKLPADYILQGQQAKYRTLSPEEYKRELIRKIVEEATEIETNNPAEIIGEIADIQQVIDDLMVLCGITKEQLDTIKQTKLDSKGGFATGAYVTTLTLANDDKWVEYYRQRPNVFPEK